MSERREVTAGAALWQRVGAKVARLAEAPLAPLARRAQTTRWWVPLVAGILLLAVAGATMVVVGRQLELMHGPGRPGYGAQGLLSTSHLHDAVEEWTRYWFGTDRDPTAQGLARASPQTLAIAWILVDLLVFIPGYAIAGGTLLLRAGRRGAAGLLVLVVLLDVAENLSTFAVLAFSWPDAPGLALAGVIAGVTIAKSLAGIPVLIAVLMASVPVALRAWKGRSARARA